MRAAGIPSFSMNRAVLPDTLEKYTSSGALVAIAALMSSREAGGQLVDLVGTEARPVVFVGDDDRRLKVAERLDVLEGRGVLGEVEDLVVDALRIQCPIGRVALNARRLRVDRDRHVNRRLPSKIRVLLGQA